MPYIPRKSNKRPWQAESRPFEGRIQSTFYWSTIWRRKRAAYIREHPLCRHCEAQGIVHPTQEIDHIKPINPLDAWDMKDGKYGHPLDDDNLQPLCKSCHAKKTAKSKSIETR